METPETTNRRVFPPRSLTTPRVRRRHNSIAAKRKIAFLESQLEHQKKLMLRDEQQKNASCFNAYLINELCPINQLNAVKERITNKTDYKSLCPVKLNGQPSFALIDSGNVVVNAISADFAQSLYGSNWKNEIENAGKYSEIGTAEKGARLDVLGQTKKPIALRFGGVAKTFMTTPIVIRGLSMDVNISGPFLCEHQIDQLHSVGALRVNGRVVKLVNCVRARRLGVRTIKKMNIAQLDIARQWVPAKEARETELQQHRKECEHSGGYKVYVVNDQIVPPNSAAFVKLRIPQFEGAPTVEREGSVKCSFSFANKTELHPAIEVAVRTTKTGECYSSVMNLTHEPLTLKEGTKFGVFEINQERVLRAKVDKIQGISSISQSKKKMSLTERRLWLVKEFQLDESPYLRKDKVMYEQVMKLLLDYFDIMSKDDEYGKTNLVQHEIRTQDVPPVKMKGMPINPTLQENLKEQMDKWKEQGVIEKSFSPWSAGLIPVFKANGKIRWVVDYRKLNEVTLKDAHPLPNMEDNMARLANSKVFSAIDGAGAFHAVTIRKQDREKTAFNTPWGLWQFKQMPFGLCNAPATYSRLVQRVLEDIPTSVALPYLDDTCVHSKTTKEHLESLKLVFEAHRKAGLMLQPSKCRIFQEQVHYLGHLITGAGVQPRKDYVEVVKNWPLPKDLKQWRTFLGKVAYYRKFIPQFSAIAGPLYSLLAKDCKTDLSAIDVGSKEEIAFQQLKKALVSAPILAYPDFKSSSPFILDTDWSADPGAIGGVLSQVQDGVERVICYGARKLTPRERNYSSNKGELLAFIHFIHSWKYYLQHRLFLFRTDHQALQWLSTMKAPTGITARWLEALSGFLFAVVHRAGTAHGNADALSRCEHAREPTKEEIAASNEEALHIIPQLEPTIAAIRTPVRQLSLEEIMRHQTADEDMKKVYTWVQHGEKPSKMDVRQESNEVRTYVALFELLHITPEGVLMRRAEEGEAVKEDRICLPESLQGYTIQIAHEDVGGHMGQKTTVERVNHRYYFPGIRKAVERFVGGCLVCQQKAGRGKDQKHTLVSVQEGNPWQKLSIDYVGPLETSKKGNKYLFTVKDCFTRWLEAFPMPKIDVQATVEILESQIFSRYGIPEQIHSDQGAQFTSEMFREVLAKLNIKPTTTPAYNPKSNPVERSHRDLKAIIKSICHDTGQDWEEVLPTALLAIRTARNRTTGVTPYFACNNRECPLPLDLIYDNPRETFPPQSLYDVDIQKRHRSAFKFMRENMKMAVERARMDYSAKLRGKPLAEDQLMWLFTPKINKSVGAKFSMYWTGPWVIIKKISDVIFRIKTYGEWNKTRIEVVVGIDRLKHYNERLDKPIPPMNLTLEDVAVDDEFVEQGVENPDELPQFTLLPPRFRVDYPDDPDPNLEGPGTGILGGGMPAAPTATTAAAPATSSALPVFNGQQSQLPTVIEETVEEVEMGETSHHSEVPEEALPEGMVDTTIEEEMFSREMFEPEDEFHQGGEEESAKNKGQKRRRPNESTDADGSKTTEDEEEMPTPRVEPTPPPLTLPKLITPPLIPEPPPPAKSPTPPPLPPLIPTPIPPERTPTPPPPPSTQLKEPMAAKPPIPPVEKEEIRTTTPLPPPISIPVASEEGKKEVMTDVVPATALAPPAVPETPAIMMPPPPPPPPPPAKTKKKRSTMTGTFLFKKAGSKTADVSVPPPLPSIPLPPPPRAITPTPMVIERKATPAKIYGNTSKWQDLLKPREEKRKTSKGMEQQVENDERYKPSAPPIELLYEETTTTPATEQIDADIPAQISEEVISTDPVLPPAPIRESRVSDNPSPKITRTRRVRARTPPSSSDDQQGKRTRAAGYLKVAKARYGEDVTKGDPHRRTNPLQMTTRFQARKRAEALKSSTPKPSEDDESNTEEIPETRSPRIRPSASPSGDEAQILPSGDESMSASRRAGPIASSDEDMPAQGHSKSDTSVEGEHLPVRHRKRKEGTVSANTSQRVAPKTKRK